MFRLHNAARALLDRYRTRGSASSLLVSRVILLIPLALVSVSFILAAVSVFAGIQKGPLEDYDIMRVNNFSPRTHVTLLANWSHNRSTRPD